MISYFVFLVIQVVVRQHLELVSTLGNCLLSWLLSMCVFRLNLNELFFLFLETREDIVAALGQEVSETVL